MIRALSLRTGFRRAYVPSMESVVRLRLDPPDPVGCEGATVLTLTQLNFLPQVVILLLTQVGHDLKIHTRGKQK